MHRSLSAIRLALLALALPLAAQTQFDKSYAVVIGIDRYASARWPKLSYALADATAMADYFRSQNFEVTALLGERATKQAIRQAMQNDLAPRLRRSDRVVVFFAGHGYTETLGGREKGYLVPYDANDSSASFLSMAELQEQSENMGNARHQLFLIDSCFGGLFATRGVHLDTNVPNYIAQITARAARQVLTAGGRNQEVLDAGPGGHSPFVAALLRGLQNGLADVNGDGFITFAELQDYVLSTASNAYQTPAAASLPGHEGGEFVFRGAAARYAAPPPAASESVTTRGATPSYTPPNQKGPAVKSQAEFQGIQALFAIKSDPDATIRAAEDVLGRFPDTQFADAICYLEADAWRTKGDLTKALIYAERAFASNPANYQANLMAAEMIARSTKEYDLDKTERLVRAETYVRRALDSLRTASKPNPQLSDADWASSRRYLDADGHNTLGTIALTRKDYDTAIREFRTAVAGNPEPAYETRLASALLSAGRKQECIAICDRLLADPQLHPQIRVALQQIRNSAK